MEGVLFRCNPFKTKYATTCGGVMTVKKVITCYLQSEMDRDNDNFACER